MRRLLYLNQYNSSIQIANNICHSTVILVEVLELARTIQIYSVVNNILYSITSLTVFIFSRESFGSETYIFRGDAAFELVRGIQSIQ